MLAISGLHSVHFGLELVELALDLLGLVQKFQAQLLLIHRERLLELMDQQERLVDVALVLSMDTAIQLRSGLRIVVAIVLAGRQVV